MPDAWRQGHRPVTLDAELSLLEALRRLVRARSEYAQLPPELREVVAAVELVRMAKDLERRAVAVARNVRAPDGSPAVRTVTGGVSRSGTLSWAAIGAALGITAQSAHERWARKLESRERT